MKAEMQAVIATAATPLADRSNWRPAAENAAHPSISVVGTPQSPGGASESAHASIPATPPFQADGEFTSDHMPQSRSPSTEPPAAAAAPTALELAAVLERAAAELLEGAEVLRNEEPTAPLVALQQRLSVLERDLARHGARCRACAAATAFLEPGGSGAATGGSGLGSSSSSSSGCMPLTPPPPPPQPHSKPMLGDGDGGRDGRHACGEAAASGGDESARLCRTPPASPPRRHGSSPLVLTPSYGDTGMAASRLQARWRGKLQRQAADAQHVPALRLRGRAAHALRQSESEYGELLGRVLAHVLPPLRRQRVQSGTVPAETLASLVAHLQVLRNLSRIMTAQLAAAASAPVAPSAAAASTLLALLPSYKIYMLYVGVLPGMLQRLAALRAEDSEADAMLCEAESAAGATARVGGDGPSSLDSTVTALLTAPTRRLAEYSGHVEAMLQHTPVDALERADFCRALMAVNELCALVDSALADHDGRARVGVLATTLAPALAGHPQLPDGLAVPHRRFVCEGALTELSLDGCASDGRPRRVYLFNDMMLVLTAKSATDEEGGRALCLDGGDEGDCQGGGEADGAADSVVQQQFVECISLAKVQVKNLPESSSVGAAGHARSAFELWSMARIWRYAAPSEADRAHWVERIQLQVRALLASFKQRGKSLGAATDGRTRRSTTPSPTHSTPRPIAHPSTPRPIAHPFNPAIATPPR